MKILKPIAAASHVARCFGALLCAAALALPTGTAHAQTPFYQASAQDIAGPPGTLIRSEPMAFAPAGAEAYRVLYRSTGMHGEPIVRIDDRAWLSFPARILNWIQSVCQEERSSETAISYPHPATAQPGNEGRPN